SRPRAARSLRRTEHCLHVGNGGAAVLRNEASHARWDSRPQAALHRREYFLLSISRRSWGGRGARPLLLWPLADQANPKLSVPRDRHSHLLALLLFGRGRRCGGLS